MDPAQVSSDMSPSSKGERHACIAASPLLSPTSRPQRPCGHASSAPANSSNTTPAASTKNRALLIRRRCLGIPTQRKHDGSGDHDCDDLEGNQHGILSMLINVILTPMNINTNA